MRRILFAMLFLSLSITGASAAHCRGSSGKFIKCPAAAKVVHCRDNSGKFIKCGGAATGK